MRLKGFVNLATKEKSVEILQKGKENRIYGVECRVWTIATRQEKFEVFYVSHVIRVSDL